METNMKRLALIALTLVILVPTVADASSRSCNTTLVSQNVCRDSTNLVLFYDAPASAFADLRDAILEGENYQDEVVCAPTRQYDPLLNGQASKVLNAAGQAEDSCPTVGQPVANPQGTAEFADAAIDRYLRNLVIAWKHNSAQEAANDPTSIETPDGGGEN
jgi:hypothetical protein